MINKIFFYSVKSRRFYFATQLLFIIVLLPIVVACSSGSGTPANNGNTPTGSSAAVELCISENKSFVDTNIAGADIIDGGLAYDKWWVTNRGATEPLDNHPLWSTQTTNTRTGSVTWRCKECHGWDYQGKDGAYGPTNSHFTNFIGVSGATEKNPADVFCTIKSLENHAFGDVMTDNNILDLTAFIVDFDGQSEGIIDYNVVLNSDNLSTGDGSVGGTGNQDYDSNGAGGCGSTACHDTDGSKNAGGEFLADIALANPWEFLHKVRYGQPGANMPSGIGNLEFQSQMANILAYTQTQLPQQNQNAVAACIDTNTAFVNANIAGADIIDGGLAYDKWWVTNRGATEPLDNHPLWSTQTTNTRTGSVTWRCKECHGWDYQGKDGAYGPTNSHFTNFIGVSGATEKNPADVFCTIKSLENHAFGDVMTDNNILDLTAFIVDFDGQSEGIIDYNVVLNSDNLSTGDGSVGGTGNQDYDSNGAGGCGSTACHDTDGSKNAGGEFLADIALANPWEFLHKVRYGQPGANMPSGIGNLEFQSQMANILAYTQTQLPQQNQNAVAACIDTNTAFVNANIAGADIIDGGLAYDKWWVAYRGTVEPLIDHPLWSTQTTNTRTGSVTWRCKECHGWDYQGKDGAYGPTNSHFTNFIGVSGAREKNPADVFCTIKSLENHAFGDVMTDSNILDLTAFIVDFGGQSEGIIDYNVVLNSDDLSTGDGSVGGPGDQNYNDVDGCGSTDCHGIDGTQNAGNEFSIGDVALDNPWEFLHKIRYGQPGANMPSGISDSNLEFQPQMADILAYAQTQLPQQNPGGGSTIEGDYIRGGMLYDNWPAMLTAEGSATAQPTTTMPLFELRNNKLVNTKSGLETWRCKGCHGWDYQGKDGAYGDPTGSNFTGFTGVLAARNDPGVTESFLLNFLKNGYTDNNNITYHKFTPYMTEADLIQLVSFIKEGVIDTDRYISTTPIGAGKGNPVNGQLLYNLNTVDVNLTPGCSRCHELNGTGIDFDPDPIVTEFLKDLAIRNPWEVLHKIRFGEPNSIGIVNLEMPGTLRDGFTNADAADILTYSQKLPQ